MSGGLAAVIAHCCCLGWLLLLLLLLRRARIGRRRVGLVLVRHFPRLWHERVFWLCTLMLRGGVSGCAPHDIGAPSGAPACVSRRNCNAARCTWGQSCSFERRWLL